MAKCENCKKRDADIEMTCRIISKEIEVFGVLLGVDRVTVRLCLRCAARHHLELAHTLINKDNIFDESASET